MELPHFKNLLKLMDFLSTKKKKQEELLLFLLVYLLTQSMLYFVVLLSFVAIVRGVSEIRPKCLLTKRNGYFYEITFNKKKTMIYLKY